MHLILASASPRRQQLLKEAGFKFGVRPASVPEIQQPNERPEEFARRAAREKALAVAASASAGAIVLGADTVVVIRGEVLGKPIDAEDAKRMLRLLSGGTHEVITGVCIVRSPDRLEAITHETTLVTFRDLSEQEIAEYVASREPFDKAGAYAIQGLASKFIKRVEGDYSNVVGLPVSLVSELLKPLLRAATE